MRYSITTTLPYVNADPHIGFALEIIQTDAIARLRRMYGDEVIFNTGTDEHGQKIYKNALAAGMDPQTYCDQYAAKFNGLKEALNVSYTNFIRTTDPRHIAAAQEFWRICSANGDIYKADYAVKYCIGCELEKTDSELTDGVCPVHPNLDIEERHEENYYFRWSKYGEALLARYRQEPAFVIPASRLKEITTFVEGGLQDFSISRLKEKMPWGIPVPDDENHVMYVWFDALVNYISTLGWPNANSDYEKGFWPSVQTAGKDNLRQQAAMWQAMLLSAGLPMAKQIFIHGFITAEGKKMSKSMGNVIDPYELTKEYGTDAVRHYLLSALPAYEDGDFSIRIFREHYGTKLANGIGNLTARTATMVAKYADGTIPKPEADIFNTELFWTAYTEALTTFHFDEAGRILDGYVSSVNKAIDDEAPFKKAKEGVDVRPFMYQIAEALRHIGMATLPIMPETGKRIVEQFNIDPETIRLPKDSVWGGLTEGTTMTKADMLFPRLEA